MASCPDTGRAQTIHQPTFQNPPVSSPAASSRARLTATLANCTLYSLCDSGVATRYGGFAGGLGRFVVDRQADNRLDRLFRNPGRRRNLTQHDPGVGHDYRREWPATAAAETSG